MEWNFNLTLYPTYFKSAYSLCETDKLLINNLNCIVDQNLFGSLLSKIVRLETLIPYQNRGHHSQRLVFKRNIARRLGATAARQFYGGWTYADTWTCHHQLLEDAASDKKSRTMRIIAGVAHCTLAALSDKTLSQGRLTSNSVVCREGCIELNALKMMMM